MDPKKKNARTLIGVIAASVLVVSLIALLTVFNGDLHHGGIVLPENGTNTTPSDTDLSEAGFVTLTTENVSEVVRTLARPSCYHQTLIASVPAGENPAETSIDIWVCENVWKIVRQDPSGTRCVLTDGRRAYLWYADDVRSMSSLILPEDVTRDELAGIVTYETIINMPADHVMKANYEPLSADSEIYCLSVQTKDGGDAAAYQIDLASGLLLTAELQRNGESTYALRQTALELLTADDAELLGEMRLPVGTADFSAETEMLQG